MAYARSRPAAHWAPMQQNIHDMTPQDTRIHQLGSYCVTGPAIGPEGRGHLHAVNCRTGGPSWGRFHTHGMGAAGDKGQLVRNLAIAGAVIVGAAWFFGPRSRLM